MTTRWMFLLLIPALLACGVPPSYDVKAVSRKYQSYVGGPISEFITLKVGVLPDKTLEAEDGGRVYGWGGGYPITVSVGEDGRVRTIVWYGEDYKWHVVREREVKP